MTSIKLTNGTKLLTKFVKWTIRVGIENGYLIINLLKEYNDEWMHLSGLLLMHRKLAFRLSQCEKYPSIWMLKIQQSFNWSFIFKGKMSIKPKKNKNMVVATKFKFGSRLCVTKVLAPHTSVVLNRNNLVNFVNMSVIFRY